MYVHVIYVFLYVYLYMHLNVYMYLITYVSYTAGVRGGLKYLNKQSAIDLRGGERRWGKGTGHKLLMGPKGLPPSLGSM